MARGEGSRLTGALKTATRVLKGLVDQGWRWLSQRVAQACRRLPLDEVLARLRAQQQGSGRALIALPQRGRALIALPLARGRALMAVPAAKGRALMRHVPPPVQIQLERVCRRSCRLGMEVFAGLMVVAAVGLMLAYGRLNQGPISFAVLVPTLEEAINRELSGITVTIDDAVVQRVPGSARIQFRLRNIRLMDEGGGIVAEAPLAAIGLSGSALLTGRIAAGSVDFIGPRLLLFYNEQQGLTLTFSRATDGGGAAALRGSVPASGGMEQSDAGPGVGEAAQGPSRLDLTRAIAEAIQRARRGRTASSYLTRFGVRDAVVMVDRDGTYSTMQVPDFAIDLQHREKRSVLQGEAEIDSPSGPWRFQFHSEQSDKSRRLTLTALIQDLVPANLAESFPTVRSLAMTQMPVSAETRLHLSEEGALLGAEARMRLAAGHIMVPWDPTHKMLIDEGDLVLRYDAEKNVVELLPSTLQWGQSRATVAGHFRPVEGDGDRSRWRFSLRADDAVLAAEDAGLAPLQVDEWTAEGVLAVDSGQLTIDRFVIRAGDSSIHLAGRIADSAGSPAIRLSGRISAMPIGVLHRMWPKFLAGGARQWARERVTAGRITGGTFEIDVAADALSGLYQGGDIPDSAVAFELGGTGLEVHYMPGMPPLQTGDAVLSMRGRTFALDVPDGWIMLPSGRRVALSQGRFSMADLRQAPQEGEIVFEAAGEAPAILELLDHEPLGYARAMGIDPQAYGGRASGTFRLVLPMIQDLAFADVRLRGEARLEEATAPALFANAGMQGGSIAFNVTERALDARGEVLLNGVPAVVSWQRIFGAPEDKQPELRISALLDEADRSRLGLEVNHMIRGPMPVVVSVLRRAGEKPAVHVQADLTNSDLVLSTMGWRKRVGRAATLRFDIVEAANGGSELQDFTILGDDIAVKGWVALDENRSPTAFYFPDFSVNVVSRIEIAGRRGSDGTWDIQAFGPAYDGRQFFQSLFSAGQLVENGPTAAADTTDVKLTAEIGAVVGFFDTTVQNVTVAMHKRGGRLTAFRASGSLQGGAQIAAELQGGDRSPRVLLAESNDAGAAFRLVGFYPRVQGGEASLQVNLDGTGVASKTGTLWARDFVILGDRVVNEVLSSAADDPMVTFQGPQAMRRSAERQRIVFNQLYVPFSVGGGRFVLHDSYINGPILGATLRGEVDFNSQRIDLGGTYVPLYGLNSALGQIPIIGNLLVGRRGEGVLGITFAIQGPTSDPAVLVNPVSAVAPGIFRQMFEFTGNYPDPTAAPPSASRAGGRRPGG